MKSIQSKSLLTLIIIFFIIGFSTSAKNFISNGSGHFFDTVPIASISPTNIEGVLVKNPDWVAYPSTLQAHRKESKEYIKRYSIRERAYIIYMFNRGKKYFHKATVIFDKYNIPDEFKVLPALESNFKANAVSSAGAVGYWQLMSDLAREYGLHVGGKNDERKNFSKSTHAASRFLRDQLKYFNDDILLTVAAYNCGPGRVISAIKRSRKKDVDFWDIKKYLPAETRQFVMNFVALNVIEANYDKFIKRDLDFEEPHLIQLAAIDSVIPGDPGSGNSL